MRQQVVAVYNSGYQTAVAKVFDGSSWKTVNPMIYNGSSWQTVGGAGTLLISLLDKNGNNVLDSGGNQVLVRKD